jgi:hypothetical protein
MWNLTLFKIIQCSKCKVFSVSNTYKWNRANEGGVYYIESDSDFTSRFDTL